MANKLDRIEKDIQKVKSKIAEYNKQLRELEGQKTEQENLQIIDEGMSELQNLKTAIHEIAHATLHAIDKDATPEELAGRPDRRTREVQAESVAYTVCQHYGLDTSDYSFGYVAGWSSGKELSELKASLETIRATANDLITKIDGHLAQLQQEREAQQEQAPSIWNGLDGLINDAGAARPGSDGVGEKGRRDRQGI